MRYHEDGGTYIGEWRRGEFNGQGRREFVNGTMCVWLPPIVLGLVDVLSPLMLIGYGRGRCSYEGGYVMGSMHGQGKLTLPSMDYYLGEFEDNAFNGTGTFVFANGDRYVGTFLVGVARSQPCDCVRGLLTTALCLAARSVLWTWPICVCWRRVLRWRIPCY